MATLDRQELRDKIKALDVERRRISDASPEGAELDEALEAYDETHWEDYSECEDFDEDGCARVCALSHAVLLSGDRIVSDADNNMALAAMIPGWPEEVFVPDTGEDELEEQLVDEA